MNEADDRAQPALETALIEQLLSQVRAQAVPVALALGGVSVAVRVDPDARLWWIDAPAAEAAPASGQLLGMSFRIDGALARCACLFDGLERAGDALLWRLRYPRRVDYPQRRQAYRAVVVPPGSVMVWFHHPSGVHRGDLLDLSSTGFGLSLAVSAATDTGRIRLELVLDDRLVLPAEVLHRSPFQGDPRRCRVGGCFVGLDTVRQARVDRAVAALQGRWLRSRARR